VLPSFIRHGAHCRQCKHRRGFEDRFLLAGRLGLELGPQVDQALTRGQPPGRQPPRLVLDGAPLRAQGRHVERRRIDGLGDAPGCALEPVEQLVDAGEIRAGVEEPLLLERRGDLRNQVTTETAHIRQRREHPHRRGAKCDDAKRFDCVSDGATRKEVVGELLA
jgi:hypothetical protein